MSAALGMATARDLKGEQHKVVAVVGDGALTCGLSYEGMNNAGHSDRDIILIVNDNGMSISPNVGAISKTLGRIVADPRTNRLREKIKGMTFALGGVFGEGVVDFAKNVEESVKNLFSPGMLFEELGLPLLRPDRRPRPPQALRHPPLRARHDRPAGDPRDDPEGEGVLASPSRNQEKWHGLAAYDPVTGEARKKASGPPTWTQVFGDGLTALAGEHPELVAITAAMPSGTGTNIFQKKYPERFFDVGHRRGSRGHLRGRARHAGHPAGGRDLQHLPPARLRQRHPRHRRAAPAGDVLHGPRGAGGRGRPDPHGAVRHRLHARGAGHDRDRAQGRRRAHRPAPHRAAATDGPFCTRYPRDKAPAEPRPAAEIPAVPYGTWEQLRRGGDVAILAVGTMVQPAVQAAELLAADGIDAAW